MRFLLRLLLNGIAIVVAAWFVPGVYLAGGIEEAESYRLCASAPTSPGRMGGASGMRSKPTSFQVSAVRRK